MDFAKVEPRTRSVTVRAWWARWSAAGPAEFPAPTMKTFLFEQHGLEPLGGGIQRGRETGGTGADDDDVGRLDVVDDVDARRRG
jgi:hypothetical protein